MDLSIGFYFPLINREIGSDARGPGKSALELLHDRLQKRELKPVDHSDFWRSFLFRKRFYTEPRNVTALSEACLLRRSESSMVKRHDLYRLMSRRAPMGLLLRPAVQEKLRYMLHGFENSSTLRVDMEKDCKLATKDMHLTDGVVPICWSMLQG